VTSDPIKDDQKQPSRESVSRAVWDKPGPPNRVQLGDTSRGPLDCDKLVTETSRLNFNQPRAVPWKVTTEREPLPVVETVPIDFRGGMCPTDLATNHPAFRTLQQYATQGCPANTGRHWTKDEMHAAVERGNHDSAKERDAIESYQEEIKEKVRSGQARVVLWDDIKDDPPEQLKISPLAMIPHKSRKFRAILNLSFGLRMSTHTVPSVNESTQKSRRTGRSTNWGRYSLASSRQWPRQPTTRLCSSPSTTSRMVFGECRSRREPSIILHT